MFQVSTILPRGLRTTLPRSVAQWRERRLSNENTERERFRGGDPGIFLADILIALKSVELDGRSERAVLGGLLRSERAQGASSKALQRGTLPPAGCVRAKSDLTRVLGAPLCGKRL